MSFDSWKVPELKRYLRDRGVTCHLYRKDHLLRLCSLAAELKLEILNEDLDTDEQLKKSRTTVTVDGKEINILPIQNVSIWSTNLSSLPSLESCDIMVYLVNECGWSAHRLKYYKRDHGYQLYSANHISSVVIAPVNNTPYSYVKANCIPETRQTESPYDSWVLLNATGEIISGGCTCVAGNGTCKHCIALLFSLENFNNRHKDRFSEACTDITCTWDKPKKTSEPMEIDDIDIRRDISADKKITPTAQNYSPCSHINSRAVEKDLYELFRDSNSLLLQVLDPPSDTDSTDDELVIPTMEEAMSSLTSTKPVLDQLKEIYTVDVLSEIEKITQGQSDNKAWFDHRHGRVTASVFPCVMNFKFTDKPENYILNKILGKSVVGTTVPSIAFGKKNEPVAMQQYFDLYKESHKNLKVKTCGLFVDSCYPFVGASPDGMVSCKCCGFGLIEIKCSFTYQNVEPLEACHDDHYHLYLDENNHVRLKQTSPWYVQIQGQLGICKLNWCDFVFFTKKGIIVDRITFDAEMYSDIVAKCKKFFDKYLVQALRK